jgi:hypothetical protein
MDGTDPGDAMLITPHFSTVNPAIDAENLVDDLLAAWQGWLPSQYRTTQIGVKLYDAQKPNYPVAEKLVNPDVSVASAVNRDVAVCLSFYAQHNRPRLRGRLYIPVAVTGAAVTGPHVSATIQTKVGELVPIFTGLGGIDIDWCVFSRKDNVGRSVTDWWIDNSWDTQRRRGIKATGRVKGTTSE